MQYRVRARHAMPVQSGIELAQVFGLATLPKVVKNLREGILHGFVGAIHKMPQDGL